MSARAAWGDIRAARLPAEGLHALASVRGRHNLRVSVEPTEVWVTWQEFDADVLRCLQPVRGVSFFARIDNDWVPLHHRLPALSAPPAADGVPLGRAIVPAPLDLRDAAIPLAPVTLRLLPGGSARPASAMRCPLASLHRWADTATTMTLNNVRAAICGPEAFLLGDQLPLVTNGLRYAGVGVLTPLGYRTEPQWPEALLRQACGVNDDELLVIEDNGAHALPRSVFQPLHRASLRRALTH